MRIVVFGNCSGLGGAQTSFRRLVEFLIGEKHDVGVIGLCNSNADLPQRSEIVFASGIARDGSRTAKLWQTLRAATRAKKHDPDLFVAVGLANSASMIARLLGNRSFRIAQDFIYGRRNDDSLLVDGLKGFDALAVQATSMEELLRAQGFSLRPLSWLPCFPDLPHPRFRRVPNESAKQVRLVYMGRLAGNKGLDIFLKALASVKLPAAVTVDIWGKGDQLTKLTELAESLNLGSAVQFRGEYPDGIEAARLICDYDGLVLPSTGTEGLPLILLEAMAYGVPLLATRVGAIPDCGIDNPDAVLVEPTVDSLRAGLQMFVDRTIGGKFSVERLIQYYNEHFGFGVMAARWRRMLADPRSFFHS